MPKGRYEIMRRYMPKVGGYGLDMMFRTCTVQVNLDFESEADMVKKFRVGLALQPVTTALFANSPFREGRPSGFLSYRAQVWTDVDNARAGHAALGVRGRHGLRALCRLRAGCADVFRLSRRQIYRCGGQELPRFPRPQDSRSGAHRAVDVSDWADHLTTIFPEVRLKQFLEMRGTDGGQWRRICGMPALWVGILYDSVALDAAWDLVKDWTAEERQAMRDWRRQAGLQDAVPQDHVCMSWRTACWRFPREGLQRRAALDAAGMSEEGFLNPLRELVARGYTRAEELLHSFQHEWKGDMSRLFSEYNFL